MKTTLVDALLENGMGGHEQKWATPKISTRTAEEIVDELRQAAALIKDQAPEGHVNHILHLVNELDMAIAKSKRNPAGASGSRLPQF